MSHCACDILLGATGRVNVLLTYFTCASPELGFLWRGCCVYEFIGRVRIAHQPDVVMYGIHKCSVLLVLALVTIYPRMAPEESEHRRCERDITGIQSVVDVDGRANCKDDKPNGKVPIGRNLLEPF